MMDLPALSFAEAAVARVCHDLSSPIGTLLNVLGLLEEGGEAAEEARQIAQAAAEELAIRMRVAKLLWGQAEPARSHDVPALVLPPVTARRCRVVAEHLADVPMPPAAARLLACLVAHAAERLCGTGEIILAGDAQREVLVQIAGPRAQWGDCLPPLLANPERAAAGAEARDVTGRLLVLLAQRQGARLSFLMRPGDTSPAPLLLTLART